MSKSKQLLDDYFAKRREMLKHFGAENSAWEDYHFDYIDEVWDFVGGCACSPTQCKPKSVIWGQSSILPLSVEHCCFKHDIIAVYQTMDHTLVYARSGSGGSNNALIFDNQRRFNMDDHLRYLRKNDMIQVVYPDDIQG